MAEQTLEAEIMEAVRKLDDEGKRHALALIRDLRKPKIISGKEAIRIAREINFPQEDLEEMARAIEEEFGQIEDFPEVDLDA